MTGTVTLNINLLPTYQDATGEVPIRIGSDRWISHRGTIAPPDGDPVWALADEYDVLKLPRQGQWSPDDYLRMRIRRIVEFTDGRLEFLPVPTLRHQLIAAFLYTSLWQFVTGEGLGKVLFSPLRVYIDAGRYREPDIVFLLRENLPQRTANSQFVRGADLVMEVVSEDDPGRDYHQKRREYAEAGVPEYWIVDPARRSILVLTLKGNSYEEVGEFREGQRAASALVRGFSVDVTEVFAQAEE